MTNTPNNILTEMEKDERLKTISAMVDQKLRISTDDANYLYNHGISIFTCKFCIYCCKRPFIELLPPTLLIRC